MYNFLLSILASLIASLIGYIVCRCIKNVKSHSTRGKSKSGWELGFKIKFRKFK